MILVLTKIVMMKGEDLMDTNDKDDDIESETEEDCAFLDDEVIEEQGVSFYWALDHQREDKSDNDQGNVDEKPEDHSPQTKKTKEHPLKKLLGRLEEYLKELLSWASILENTTLTQSKNFSSQFWSRMNAFNSL